MNFKKLIKSPFNISIGILKWVLFLPFIIYNSI